MRSARAVAGSLSHEGQLRVLTSRPIRFSTLRSSDLSPSMNLGTISAGKSNTYREGNVALARIPAPTAPPPALERGSSLRIASLLRSVALGECSGTFLV